MSNWPRVASTPLTDALCLPLSQPRDVVSPLTTLLVSDHLAGESHSELCHPPDEPAEIPAASFGSSVAGSASSGRSSAGMPEALSSNSPSQRAITQVARQ